MDFLLKRKHIDYLRRTYPGMTIEQALNACLNDTLNDTDLLDRAAERINARRDWIGSLVILGVVLFLAWWDLG